MAGGLGCPGLWLPPLLCPRIPLISPAGDRGTTALPPALAQTSGRCVLPQVSAHALLSGPNSEGPYNGFCTEGCPGVSYGCQGPRQPLLRLVGPRSGGPGTPLPLRKRASLYGGPSQAQALTSHFSGVFLLPAGGFDLGTLSLPSGPLPPGTSLSWPPPSCVPPFLTFAL